MDLNWRELLGLSLFLALFCAAAPRAARLSQGRWNRRSGQLRFVPRDELVEAAELSVLGFVLIQELQVRFVEFFEEFLPADLFQAFFLWAKIDAENAGVPALSGLFHGGGRPPTLIDPFFDLLVVCGGVAFTHLGNSELGLMPS